MITSHQLRRSDWEGNDWKTQFSKLQVAEIFQGFFRLPILWSQHACRHCFTKNGPNLPFNSKELCMKKNLWEMREFFFYIYMYIYIYIYFKFKNWIKLNCQEFCVMILLCYDSSVSHILSVILTICI